MATRSYFGVDPVPVSISCQVVDDSGDSQLFRGGVPQVPDWLRAWRACRTPTSFRAAEKHGITNNFINSARALVPIRRKAFRSMVRVMSLVLRRRHKAALLAAKNVSLALDDRGAYRLVRYRCDVPWPGCGDASLTESSSSSCQVVCSTSGVLAVLRRGGCPSSKTLEGISDDYSRRMSESVLRAIDRICTGGDNLVDQSSVDAIRAKVRIGVADGAAPVQKCLRFLAAGSCPNMLALVRDCAHKARNSTRDPLIHHDGFAAWYDDVFDSRHALVPDIMNSDAWLEKLLLCQRKVIESSGSQGGVTAAQHVLRFAKQRFESCASPQRQFCCMLVAIAMVLAYQACDLRNDAEVRKRAERRLEEMPSYVLPQGLAASYSAEMLDFVRLFDVECHDPALSWGQVRRWKQRVTALFVEGRIFMDPGPGQGRTCFQIIYEAASTAKPIYYGNKVVHLHSKPTHAVAKKMSQAVHEATRLAIERIDVEFDIRRPEVAFTALDIARWAAAAEENRQGRRDAWNLLSDHALKLFRVWGLSGSRGVPELESCAWALVAAERERRAEEIDPYNLDNRVLWSRVLDPTFVRRVSSSGELQVLPRLVRIYAPRMELATSSATSVT